MHRSDVPDGENRIWSCHHYGDFSGDVLITISDADLDSSVELAARGLKAVKIPFDVMKELVGRYLIASKIDTLEQLTGAQLVDALRLPVPELD